MYKPCPLMGLELGISVLSGALRCEPTEQPQVWWGDVVAVAKRELSAGETLDGEGGYTVWGKLAPAEHSLAHGALPIGLASHVELQRDIAAGMIVCSADVAEQGLDDQAPKNGNRNALTERWQAELPKVLRPRARLQ